MLYNYSVANSFVMHSSVVSVTEHQSGFNRGYHMD